MVEIIKQRSKLAEAWIVARPVIQGWASYRTSDGLRSQLCPRGETEAVATPMECASYVEAALEGVVPPGKARGVKDRLRACLKSGPLAFGIEDGKFADLDALRDLVILDIARQVGVTRRV